MNNTPQRDPGRNARDVNRSKSSDANDANEHLSEESTGMIDPRDLTETPPVPNDILKPLPSRTGSDDREEAG